jgi:hypothetical protein
MAAGRRVVGDVADGAPDGQEGSGEPERGGLGLDPALSDLVLAVNRARIPLETPGYT